MNRVSVIIPNYNRSGLVNETVRNVLAQSLAPHEVIVIDDGSTDDSVDSLRSEFGDQIRLIQQANQGPGAARNEGLDRATGDYVWLMDSDDLSSLNKLETQVDALQTSNADIVYSPWARVFIDENRISMDGPVLQQRPVPESRTPLQWFLTDWSLVFQHCLFRTSILRAAGQYRTDMWTCDDSEYFVRILTKDAKVVFDDRSITLYRADDHGKVTGSGFVSSRRISDWAKCLIAMHDLCKSNPELTNHVEFQMRVWKSISEMEQHCPDEQTLIADLKSRSQGSSTEYAIRLFVQRIRKALRTRFSKTHWSPAFQTGSLTATQQNMIEELGFVAR
ncbi:glycosyltransferase family 2 protein [Rhodopirellula sallentina]|uniref:Glycosyl transferase family protein n=1 Tax=Rhodopirellula sallentina SM41 TaxID=1263870 RepID=M5TSY5_9BACT|nr:glycosyltransferase family 2 protein [Rhodopirellula sallentina]EMI52265.1 glycosyl transferase family protein [Rhodopirellula sallentina SM41]